MSTWMRLSKTLVTQNKISDARAAIMEALALDPNNIKITKNLIGLELANNNTREAEKLIDGLSVDKSSSLALALRAALASKKQDHAEAAELYRSLWQQSPSDDTGLKLYLSYQQLKDNQAIDTFISEWLTRFPDSIAVLRIQGERFLAQGKNLDAISTYQKLLEKTPNDVSTLNNLAWLLHVNKDNTTAIRHAQKAYQLAPESAAIADTYGWILSENGDHKEAVAILTKATELAPDNEEIRQHLQTAKAKAK
jgi:Flp pilus assembly protein TadD